MMTENQIQKLLSKPTNVIGFIEKYCGPKIGNGNFRDVYIFKPDDRYVVKIERKPKYRTFANVTEFRYWIDNREVEWFAKWFAPCIAISQDGEILIQRRVQRNIDLKDAGKKVPQAPKKLPSWFTDKKLANYGWLDGKFVCFDYSFIIRRVDTKLKKVIWR